MPLPAMHASDIAIYSCILLINFILRNNIIDIDKAIRCVNYIKWVATFLFLYIRVVHHI